MERVVDLPSGPVVQSSTGMGQDMQSGESSEEFLSRLETLVVVCLASWCVCSGATSLLVVFPTDATDQPGLDMSKRIGLCSGDPRKLCYYCSEGRMSQSATLIVVKSSQACRSSIQIRKNLYPVWRDKDRMLVRQQERYSDSFKLSVLDQFGLIYAMMLR